MSQDPQQPHDPYRQPPPPPTGWEPQSQQPQSYQPQGQQPVVWQPTYPAQPQPGAYGYGYGYGAPGMPQQPPVSGLYQAAAIVNWVMLGIITLSTCGIGIIAAAWFVPMTMAIHRGARDRSKHTALAVCTLLFCGIVPGILMLVEEGERQ